MYFLSIAITNKAEHVTIGLWMTTSRTSDARRSRIKEEVQWEEEAPTLIGSIRSTVCEQLVYLIL